MLARKCLPAMFVPSYRCLKNDWGCGNASNWTLPFKQQRDSVSWGNFNAPQCVHSTLTPRSHYPGLARVFSTWVIELGLALVHTTASYAIPSQLRANPCQPTSPCRAMLDPVRHGSIDSHSSLFQAVPCSTRVRG